MKKLLWRMAAIAAFVFASCSGGAPSEKVYRLNDVEYIPVCLIDSEGWSMIAPDGKYLFKDKFDNSNDGMTVAINGFFSVRTAGRITVYSATADPQPVPGLSGLSSAGYLSEDKIPVCFPGEPISIMDADGTRAFTLEGYDGHEIVRCGVAYTDGLLWVEDENGKHGYVDRYGNLAIPIEYDSAYEFENGYTVVYKNDIGQILDVDGKTVLTFGKDEVCSGIRGHQALTHIGDSYTVVDFDGTRRNLPPQYNIVLHWDINYIVAGTADGCYVLRNNDNFDIVLSTNDAFAVILPNDEFFVKNDNGAYSRINAKGETLETYDDNTLSYFGSRWGLLSTSEDGISHFLSLKGNHRSEDFQTFSTHFSFEYCVSSDVFSLEDMAQDFFELLSDEKDASVRIGDKISRYTDEDDLFALDSNIYCSKNWIITPGRGFRILSNFVAETKPESSANIMDSSVKYPIYISMLDKPYDNVSTDFRSLLENKFRDTGFVKTFSNNTNICMSKDGMNVMIESVYSDEPALWIVVANAFLGELTYENLLQVFNDLHIEQILSMEESGMPVSE